MKTTFFLLSLLAASIAFPALAAETRVFQENAVEINGTKFWLPSVIVVRKGDTVKIHAASKIPNSPHGFEIQAFNVKEVVDNKGKDITFVADKAGVFPMSCQLHAAHVGGEVVVLE